MSETIVTVVVVSVISTVIAGVVLGVGMLIGWVYTALSRPAEAQEQQASLMSLYNESLDAPLISPEVGELQALHQSMESMEAPQVIKRGRGRTRKELIIH